MSEIEFKTAKDCFNNTTDILISYPLTGYKIHIPRIMSDDDIEKLVENFAELVSVLKLDKFI